jgi:hypothetical protein
MGVTAVAVVAVDAVVADAVDDCCFSEMDSTGTTALIRPFVVFVFVVFKVKMSSLCATAPAAAVVLDVCVEGGLCFLTTEAQEDFIECNEYK